MTHRILILDDEPKMGTLLQRSLERDGYDVAAFDKPAEALDALKAGGIDVLVTDLRMPGMDGLEVLRRAKSIAPQTEVILMTAYASVETAREALMRGALDYLVKPVSAENDLKPLLARLFAGDADAPQHLETPLPPPTHSASPGLVMDSPAMQSIMAKLDKIARSGASVLLRGESGTGKEVLADLIQSRSTRAGKPYIKINCGALTETLLAAELFGHVKGAFTGAAADRAGHFESADGGTLMLDEVGEVSPALQVKLLRVLQSGEYQRVGESATRKCDVRIIAATNRNLEEMVESGEFRQDLYYRLNVVPIVLPPLRERREDIEKLIAHFARRYGGGVEARFTDDALKALLDYHWPGNIRELENAIEHALVLGDPSGILVEDLPAAVQQHREKSAQAASPAAVGASSLEDIEKRCLLSALQKTNGNRTRAAHLLGITRRTLGYRLRKYGLEDEAARIAAGQVEE
ncbi:MAG: two-component system, NtrC family, response regulator AtoC [Candidatus Sumerlaeota bacterium]|nr:two-component system, NtrC family, response regulator AtoC [Candidatus Sumerlaeota bacterium]